MSVVRDFAEWFKSRETPIEQWYTDGVGVFAFRVTVDDQSFVCTARNTPPNGGHTSIMNRVAGEAQTSDALILLRLRGGTYVLDPVTVLGIGERDDVTETARRERGEKWVRFPVSLGCDFDDWYDGDAEPTRYANVDDYA